MKIAETHGFYIHFPNTLRGVARQARICRSTIPSVRRVSGLRTSLVSGQCCWRIRYCLRFVEKSSHQGDHQVKESSARFLRCSERASLVNLTSASIVRRNARPFTRHLGGLPFQRFACRLSPPRRSHLARNQGFVKALGPCVLS